MEFDLKHVGKLSKLTLTEAEIKEFDGQIKGMLKMLDVLPQAQKDEIPRVSSCGQCVLREDTVTPSADVEEALKNAPEQKAGCFVVPAIR